MWLQSPGGTTRVNRALDQLIGVIPCLITLLLIPCMAPASEAYRFDAQHEVIGQIRPYTVTGNESLFEIARTYNTGFNELTKANPRIDPYVPGKGTSLILPTAWVLPDASREPGIVINVSEMRLYYFFRKDGVRMVRTFPVGIGDEGSNTPLGTFTVIEKIVHPAWFVPESIRREKPELPAVVPPGPDNPMGSHALRLSDKTVLIHGTDVPWGIGRRVSHGCIRLYPEDIIELFRLVQVKTRVIIVQQPVKVGTTGGHVYVEISSDSTLPSYDYLGETKALLIERGLMDKVNTDVLLRTVQEKSGLPVDVSLVR